MTLQQKQQDLARRIRAHCPETMELSTYSTSDNPIYVNELNFSHLMRAIGTTYGQMKINTDGSIEVLGILGEIEI